MRDLGEGAISMAGAAGGGRAGAIAGNDPLAARRATSRLARAARLELAVLSTL
ncbi:MAG TPA: hypothetical protein VLU54_03290 [Casimicrobiaceae bacterium]|nr:hypothetical protein [Casimicrobiaceae bacterium]